MHTTTNQIMEDIMKYVVALFLCVVLIVGCGDENNMPVIENIHAPDEVHAGARIELEATVADEDGDTLVYKWEGPGFFSSETTLTTIWAAPVETGAATVTFTVDDGINEVTTTSIEVNVIHALIVPGREAGGIRLGDEYDMVKALYGEPDSFGHNLFSYWNQDSGFSGFVDGIGLVDSLFLSSPNTSKTAGGNGIGSALSSIEAEFGMAKEINDDEDDDGEDHWYWTMGIQFDYDAGSNVERIYVFKPHIHFAGAPVQYGDVTIQQEQLLQNKAAFEAFTGTALRR